MDHDSQRVLGTSVPRKEDRRILTGQSRFVGDITLPGVVHLAFVRSTSAHARVAVADTKAALAADGVVDVLTGADPDLAGVGLLARSALSSYVETVQPVLAQGKVRFAGEAVAAVVGVDVARARDAAELVEVSYEDLGVVVDVLEASAPDCPVQVHAEAEGNAYLRRHFEGGDPDGALARSAVVVEQTFRTNRHAGVPLEGRGCVASWDPGEQALTLWLSTQIPHLTRHVLAEILGLPETKVRVVAPDVGGGFGVKTAVYPEEVVACMASRRLGRPVKWVEDRGEHLLAACHARDHVYRVRAGFEADGSITAVDVEIFCNAGAYSVFPFTAGVEALMAGGLFTGPYKVQHYRADVTALATNTAPAGPYRGVARPATVYVMERLLDMAAARLGVDAIEIRRRNLITAEEMPYTSPTRLVHDSRTYGACLDEMVRRLGYEDFRATQRAVRAEDPPRYLGLGLAVYNELTGMGRAASAGPRVPFRTGHEIVTVRINPGGGVQVLSGSVSMGQGTQTTYAQLAADALGVPYDAVDVTIGDTAAGGFGFGAFASRQGVIGGGAVVKASEALREKLVRVAAHLLEASPDDLTVTGGVVHAVDAPTRGLTVAEVAHVAYLESHRLPEDLEPGLEATRSYDPVLGSFAAGAQAAVVEVDTATGRVEIQRFICVEDAGTVYHPQIVEGQVTGAIVQGIGGALFEHHIYEPDGQLQTATLMDYLMPSAAEIPPIEIGHVNDPADNLTGARGVGEGGTLGVAAALAGAVADALAPLGAEIIDLPLSPEKVFAAIRAVSS